MALEPSVRIVGEEDDDIQSGVTAVPAFNGHTSVLMLNRDPTYDRPPKSYVLDGNIPPGTYSVADLWDGYSTFDVPIGDDWVRSAGDVNADGHLDA